MLKYRFPVMQAMNFLWYNRYLLAASFGRRLANVPMPLRKFLGSGLTSVSAEKWNMLKCHSTIFPTISKISTTRR